MSTSYFLSHAQASPPVLPPERWRAAFPQGQWGDWSRLSASLQAGDLVWLSVGYPLWLEVLAQLLGLQPAARVIVLSSVPDQTEGLRAIHQGARGYCHLYAAPEMLQDVGTVVAQGGLWLGPELVDRIVAATRELLDRSPAAAETIPVVDLSALSARELEVARAVAAGRSNREVAEALFISERTVKAHLSAVFEKLGVRDRLQLTLQLSGRGATRPEPRPQ